MSVKAPAAHAGRARLCVLALLGLAALAAACRTAGFAAALPAEVADGTGWGKSSATVNLWQRFPITGTGLATFREASPTVVPREASGAWYWHAHNDYLEVLATTGVVGAALLLLAIVLVVRRLGHTTLYATRSEDRAAGLAALGALAGVAVHSLFDFGLSMPANAATLAILCGAALAVKVEKRSMTPA